MRFALGLIVGVLITIAAAYLRDAAQPTGAEARPMVNWDVVDHSVHDLSETVRDQWARLVGGVRRAEKNI
ncbi:MAG: hypothetical protein JOZ16_04355 [Methylobacteriaceae bacterium]|nr:hypothetical protein [Methylobacteriaceae bacterium]